MARGGYRPGAGRKPAASSNIVDASGAPMRTATPSMGKFQQTRDAFVNYPAKLGLGAQNILTSSSVSFNPLSRIRTVIEWMYRQQFVVRNAVDVIPEDMTRQGVDIMGPMKPKDIAKIDNFATKYNIWGSVRQVLKWARLYGGCVGYLVIDGQRPEDPFRLETVGKDQFKGIMPLDRWMIDPSLELLETSTEWGAAKVGLPKFYRVTADAPALPRMKIHHSRLIRLIGADLPYWQLLYENLWGLSIIEVIQDRIYAFDIGSSGAAQLINKAFIRTFKIEGLKELIASNEVAYQGLLQLVQIMTAMQGIEGMTLMDSKDEYEGHEHGAFSGIADILQEFRQQLSGALQMPMTKLFGQAPNGMNATGESDMRNYYDMIKARQEADLKYEMTIVYKCISQSVSVKWNEDETSIDFRPLWQSTEVEKSTIAKTITDAVLAAEEKGTISTKTAMKELKQQSRLTGVWTNISEEEIEAASDVPVPAAELAMAGAGGPKLPAKTDMPVKKPTKVGTKDAWGVSGHGWQRPDRGVTFYDPNDPPNINPHRGGDMPSAVHPGARPFQDGQIAPIHARFNGLPIHIETRKGEQRMSRDPAHPWIARMAADYGFIVGTSSAEGPDEGTDVFLGKDGEGMYVINQAKPTGEFDETKFMLGFKTKLDALSTYVNSYDDPEAAHERVLSMHRVSLHDIERFLSGDMSRPYVESM